MCYLLRQEQSGAAEPDGAAAPPRPNRLRPRLAGAVAAALIGGLAVAALVAPESSPQRSTRDSAPAPAPITASAVAVPAAAIARAGSAPVDDGVPGASDVVRAGLGHCDHDL